MNRIPCNLTQRALDLACEIQAIPAPTFFEEKRANYFLDRFRQLGLEDVQLDSAGNVLARLPGIDPLARPLVVSAHTDTVYPFEIPMDLQQAGDRISGPGIGDNALGLAALILLVQMLQENRENLPGDLWLVANTCEEGLGDLKGITAIVDRFGSRPLAYLVIEGMGLGAILHRGLGVERYRIAIQTAGGHSWVNYGEPSAIHELCEVVTRLTQIPLPEKPCTTINIGVFHGGISVNAIAAEAWLELDLRSEDASALAALVRKVHSIVNAVRRPGVDVQIQQIGKRRAGQIPPYHPLVELARTVISEIGIEPILGIASTDANLPLSRGYPSICIGITKGENAHTRDEFILTEPIEKGLKQLYLLVTHSFQQLS